MRQNLPVTAHEHPLPPGAALISCTDLKGRITYANAAFIEASGFSVQELLKQPHNIVRHPDMPPQAFADLWDSLRRGLPWTGLVKNRRKNGDFYWVKANVTPIRRGGIVEGYMSVRNRPERGEVAEAERFYRELREGRAGQRAIRQGEVVSLGWRHPLAWLRRIPVQGRIVGSTGLAALACLAAAAAGAIGGWQPAAVSAGLAVCGLAWAGFGWFLQSTLLRPLAQATQVARAIAGGDLQPFRIHPQDETKELLRALNQMSANLFGIVADVGVNVTRVLSASQQIASGNQNLSARTESQASSLEETAAAMEQLTGTVKQNAAHACQANELAVSASGVAVKGGEVVAQVVDTMNAINRSSHRIVDIIGVIDGLAFQTNILALNAAVEAARAGEQGRGFAVVAGEVRSLAQRSAGAAREIKGLIQDSVDKVDQGSQLVGQAGRTMDEIVASVRRVTDIMAQITAASQEQTTGIEQINQAISQMDQITQHNAALVDEASTAARSLQDEARSLSAAVSTFSMNGPQAFRAPAVKHQREQAA